MSIVLVVLLLIVLGLVLGLPAVRERLDPTIRQVIVWVIIAACVVWFLHAVGVL